MTRQAGVNISSVKELLGHKSLSMTMRFSHLAPAHKAKAVAMLDAALNGTFAEETKTGQFGRRDRER